MTTTINSTKYIEFTTSEVILRNKLTGEETYLDSLESDSLKKAVSTEDIKGGIANKTFITINKDEKITFEAVDVLSREAINIAKWGGVLTKGSNLVATVFPQNKTTVDTSGTIKITLDETPIDDSTIALYDNKNKKTLVETTDYTISGKTITFTVGSGVAGNQTVYVSSYDYVAPADTEYYDIKGNATSQMFEAIIRKPIYDLNDTIVYWREIHCPKVQLDTSIESKGSTEKGKQTTTHTFNVLQDDTYNYQMRVIHIPA